MKGARPKRWVKFTISPIVGCGDDGPRAAFCSNPADRPMAVVTCPEATAFGSFTNETYFGRTDGSAHCIGRADRASRNLRDCGLDIRQSNLGACPPNETAAELLRRPRATRFSDNLGRDGTRRTHYLEEPVLASKNSNCPARRAYLPDTFSGSGDITRVSLPFRSRSRLKSEIIAIPRCMRLG